jgi:predicted  nucleic acid-binding Zn-ribbon protein
MDEAKLQEVINNPHGFSLDEITEAETILAQREIDGETPKVDTNAAATDGKDKDDPPKEIADAPKDDPKAVIPDGILLKDGKNFISYSVLEAERQAAQSARETARLAQQQEQNALKELQLLKEQISSSKTSAASAAGLTEEQLERFREEAPDLAGAFESQSIRLSEMEAAVKAAADAAREANDRYSKAEAARTQVEVDSAISQVPKLAHAQSLLKDGQPEVFNAIAEIDVFLRTQPSSKSMSMAQRFEKAVAMYEAANGQIQVPGLVEDKSKQLAAAAIAKAATPPSTLSDIHGGTPPGKSPIEQIEGLNTNAMLAKLESMPPADRERLLSQMSL